MHLFTFTFIPFLTGLVKALTNCDVCTQRYDFCVENGHTHGQEGCRQTCAEHVCYVLRREEGNQCKECGEVFKVCGEKSRYDF